MIRFRPLLEEECQKSSFSERRYWLSYLDVISHENWCKYACFQTVKYESASGLKRLITPYLLFLLQILLCRLLCSADFVVAHNNVDRLSEKSTPNKTN